MRAGRRDVLLALSAAALGWNRTALSQQKPKPAIGFLGVANPGGFAATVAAFHQGLRETGYVEGQNVTIEYRWAEGRYDRLPALAVDLVSQRVDVIVTSSTTGIQAAKNATSTIPIVFTGGGDPIAEGFIASLARPGGNLTGITFRTVGLMPKRLELLSELVPQAKVIALLVNLNNAANAEQMIREVHETTSAKGLQLQILKAGTDNEIDAAFATLVQLHA